MREWIAPAPVFHRRQIMRLFIAGLLFLACGLMAPGQGLKFTRYNVDYDSNSFSQDTPKQALESVIRALGEKRVDYLLAQLTDPEFVDDQVKKVHAGKFDDLVRAVKTKLANDPDVTKNLVRFSKEGKWQPGDTAASVKLNDLKDQVFFRRIGDRWFFQNQKSAASEKPAEEKKEDKKEDKKAEKVG
jgi:hypothetical protein